MNTIEIAPLKLQPLLAWLGSIEGWMTFEPAPDVINEKGEAVPSTATVGHWNKVKDKLGTDPETKELRRGFLARLWEVIKRHPHTPALAWTAACADFFGSGPKLFRPTEEQFESMEHVTLDISPSDFRSPYSSIAIAIPNGARKRIANTTGVKIENFPTLILVHQYLHPVTGIASWTVISRFGKTEQTTMFSQVRLNETVEEAICRRVNAIGDGNLSNSWDVEPEKEQARAQEFLVRTALNLCLMMTHYGSQVGGPVNPKDYEKHRSKKHLNHLKYGDCLTVTMKQDIVVRSPGHMGTGKVGVGTGTEVRPHWRKGHWRAMPGQAERRARGEKVDLVFVRPCLVRSDRVVGDLSATEVTYHG